MALNITELQSKVAEAMQAKLKDLSLDTPEAAKLFVLKAVNESLGSELKDLQKTIAAGVLSQIPASSAFSPDRGQSFDPRVGLLSMKSDQLEMLKKQVLYIFTPAEGRDYIDAQISMTSADRKGLFNGATKKDLQIQSGADGGFAVPQEFIAEVQRKLVLTSVFRNQCRVFSGVGLAGSMPRETGTVTITYAGEKVQPDTTQFALGDLTWGLSKRMALTKMTRELYRFSAVDLLNLLTTMYAEQNQLKDNAAFLNGTGKGMPMGLGVQRAGMNTTAIAGTTLDWTDIDTLKNLLKIQYRLDGGAFMMTEAGRGLIEKLADGQNRPIFLDRGPAGLASSTLAPMTIGFLLGFPVFINNDIPTVGGATEIWFCNFKRGYAIFDQGTAETRTSEEAGDAFLKNEMYARMITYDDGKPNIPEANCVLTGVK